MPQAANFTIKDGATSPVDTLFTMVQPSGGTLPATYFARAKGDSVAFQPKLAVSSKGVKNGREVHYTLRVPEVVMGTNGIPTVVDAAFATLRITLPDRVSTARRSDLRAYLANLLAITQFVETNETGYSPN